ncbi:hypothetical protein P4S95_01615 [Aneurinibacillus aneurinilyticus]|uniref:hypothetical protein n=1 Tax=Aneurinibacillus aneurinilyticus TaxID=1391 RepID=UPI002E1BCE75|nr:hypothetical protein [Aneurinibacillus aneurinilyticus]
MAPENQQEKNGAKVRRAILPVSLGLLVVTGGVAAYQWNQGSVPTNSRPTEKAEANAKKPSPSIRLNTDDNQVKNTTRIQAKKDESKQKDIGLKRKSEKAMAEPNLLQDKKSNTFAFSLKEHALGEVYDDAVDLVDVADIEKPIADLVVDQSDIVLPEPPLWLGDFSDQPIHTEMTRMEERIGQPADGEERSSNNGTRNPSGEQPVYREPSYIPSPLYDILSGYAATGDSYNVVYYGKNVNAHDGRYDDIMKLFTDSANQLKTQADAESVLSYQGHANLQLLLSLTMDQPDIKTLREETEKSIFKRYAEAEADLYAAQSKEKERAEEAKHVVYVIGKYNEQTDKPLDMSKYHGADKMLVNLANKDVKSEGDTTEALNKYQIAFQYAPDVARESGEKEKDVLESMLTSQKEAEKEAEEEKTEEVDVLAYAVHFAESDISKAVILATEAVERGDSTPEAKEQVQKLAEKLLAEAETFKPAKEEQAYEILSTRPVIAQEISRIATERKKALLYARKAEQLLDSEKYAEALYYTSESNRLYSKKGSGDSVAEQAAKKLLDQAKAEEIHTQLAIYRSISSASGVPNEYRQQAEFLQKAIDDYEKGMRENNLEQSVRLLTSAWQHPRLQKFVEAPLREKSQALLEQAKAIRNEKPQMAEQYLNMLLQISGLDNGVKESAKSMLHENHTY